MIWTLVIFGITLFILKKYVFGPVGPDHRRSVATSIAQSIDEAERSRDEATALLEDYKARLAEARARPTQLREQGRKEGERQRAELHHRRPRPSVSASSPTPRSRSRRRPARPPAGCATTSSTLALLAAEKVSRSTLNEADHRKLIEEAIAEADLSAISSGSRRSERRGHLRGGALRVGHGGRRGRRRQPLTWARSRTRSQGSAELRAVLDNPEVDTPGRRRSIVDALTDGRQPARRQLPPGAGRPRAAGRASGDRPARSTTASTRRRRASRCEAITAVPLPDRPARAHRRADPGARPASRSTLTESVDPEIVGGLVLQVGELGGGRIRPPPTSTRLASALHSVSVDAALAPS